MRGRLESAAPEGLVTGLSGLAGKTVAILEARRSTELSKLFEHRGATVYVAPALREEQETDTAFLSEFIEAICAGSFDLVFCLTGVGVRGLCEVAERLGRREPLLAALGRVPIFCRGPKPVAALRTLGLQPTHTTPSPYTSEQVLEVAAGLDLSGKRVGLLRHGGPSPELIEGLRALGATVQDVQVYHWALPDDVLPIEGLIERLQATTIDVIAFTSASQIHNLFDIARRFGQDEALLQLLRRVPAMVAVGPVCATAMRAHGVRVDVEPAEPKMGPMVLAVDEFFAVQAASH